MSQPYLYLPSGAVMEACEEYLKKHDGVIADKRKRYVERVVEKLTRPRWFRRTLTREEAETLAKQDEHYGDIGYFMASWADKVRSLHHFAAVADACAGQHVPVTPSQAGALGQGLIAAINRATQVQP